MTQEQYLIYPNVELFLYDLREGLRDSEEEVDANREQFWLRIYGDHLNRDLLATLKQRESSTADIVELLGRGKVEELQSVQEGYFRPFQLMGDTYALHVNCSAATTGQESYAPQPVSCLSRLIDYEIESKIKQTPPTLGETWMIWGQMSGNSTDFHEVAEACYLQLCPSGSWNRDFRKQVSWMQGELFEFWETSSSRAYTFSGKYVLIWIFPSTESIDLIKENTKRVYFPLLRLFSYRSKLLWAIQQSAWLEEELKKDYKSIGTIVESMNGLNNSGRRSSSEYDKLQGFLSQSLGMLHHYTYNLNLLNSQITTTDLNIDNYNARLQLMQSSYGMGSSVADLFSDFLNDQVTKRYKRTCSSYENYKSSLSVIESLITALTGTTEIYQAEEERKREDTHRRLDNRIAMFGIGLGMSQIASSVLVSQHPPTPGTLFIRTHAFLGSLAVGIASGLSVWLILWILRRLKV